MSVSAPLLYWGASAVCATAAGIVVYAGRRGWATRLLAVCCAASALWIASQASGAGVPWAGTTGLLDAAHIVLGLLLLLHLQGREKQSGLTDAWRWGYVVVAVGLGLLSFVPYPAEPNLGSPELLGRLGLAVLLVVVAENTFRNADEAARWHVNLPCIVFGVFGTLDIVVCADAVLARAYSPALLSARIVLAAAATPLLVIAALRDQRWRPRSYVSRETVFHGAALVVSGTFLGGVGLAGEVLRQFGAGWGEAARASVVAGGVMAVLVAMASRSARSRIRRSLVDPFFRSRFDYRQEWLRCVAALSAAEGELPSHIRAVRAVADAVDSPAGVLLLCELDDVVLRWGGSWNAPEPIPPPDLRELTTLLGRDDRVLDLTAPTAAPVVPALCASFGRLWLAVPLLHYREGLVGAVLLAFPRAAFRLDAEVFALLRALGREVALFVAERRATQRLIESRRLQDYAARFAFVAHDVKTVSAGLKLLLGNAETNIDNPEFQRDMLVTVRSATSRIDALIARLRQPDEKAAARGTIKDPMQQLRALGTARSRLVKVEGDATGTEIAMAPEVFDTVVGHLLDNATEASAPGDTVRLLLHPAEGRFVLDIIDTGPGMTAEFVRDQLFRPLTTAKPEGNGIGAWQARELIRAAGGDLIVLSRPGAGTTMRLVLPLRSPAVVQPT